MWCTQHGDSELGDYRSCGGSAALIRGKWALCALRIFACRVGWGFSLRRAPFQGRRTRAGKRRAYVPGDARPLGSTDLDPVAVDVLGR